MAIDIVTLAEVKMECERVLACLRRVQKECVKKDDDGKPFMPYMAGAVQTAALKRASMDLTRALAQLRRRRCR